MDTQQKSHGVTLPTGQTGSSFLRHLMSQAIERYPEDFSAFHLPTEKSFKKNYAEAVVQFEASRVSSRRRAEIARFIVRSTQEQLQYHGPDFQGPLMEFLHQPAVNVELEEEVLGGESLLSPAVPFRGRTYAGPSLKYLGQNLLAEEKITQSTARALAWIGDFASGQQGQIDLRGQKFVIMGASAELAPTPLLLAAGATVLWIDLQEPTAILAERHKYSGTLVRSRGVNNILLQAREIRASIAAFAQDEPVHIGMFAYAAGASQEWRLAATMNAIIHSLPPACVRSVSMLISPTSAAVIQPEDVSIGYQHSQRPPIWQSILKSVGVLRQSVSFDAQGIPVARAIVPLQGVSYQAAQYISKTLAAEVFATQGVALDGAPHAITVSANVAGITKTRSLQHPVFQAAFLGAEAFGVEIFEVPTTRALSTMLILHDLLHPDHKLQQDVSRLFAKQVHGGIYSRAFALDPMIRIATVMGLAQRPQLLLKILS
jgi:hypothetical protein